MEDIVLTQEEPDFIAGPLWKLSEDEKRVILPNLTPMQKRFAKLNTKGGFDAHRVVAEVDSVKNCPRQARIGGKMVFNTMGELRPSECDAFPVTGFCTLAVQMLQSYVYAVQDRILSDCEDPSPMGIDTVKCIDTKPALGGTGETCYRVYDVKEKVNVPEGMYRPGARLS